MATFTIKTSELIEEGFDFGLTDYPIFDEAYREDLNKKILEHYWNYEIGQETESMFKFSLNRKMREIMPYYNQMYKSTQIEFDPLQTIKYTDISHTENADTTIGNTTQDETGTTHTTGSETGSVDSTVDGTESGEGTSNSTTLGKSRSVSSVTPQMQLSGDEDYAASAADVNSDSNVVGESSNSSITNSTTAGTSTGSSEIDGESTNNSVANSSLNSNGTGTIERELLGSQGIASELLMLYRASFLNIDMQIISDLETLFMQIWDNGDEYSDHNSFTYGGIGYGYRLF